VKDSKRETDVSVTGVK